MKNSLTHYFIVPLYNVNINTEALDKEFDNGYKIITSQVFHTKYLPNLMDINKQLNDDTMPPKLQLGVIKKRPQAEYILIKEVALNIIDHDKYTRKNKELFDKEINFLDLFITSMRLLNAGHIHINNVYCVTEKSYQRSNTCISTNLENIDSFYHIQPEQAVTPYSPYFFDHYKIEPTTITKALQTTERLQKICDKFCIPLLYFNQYYSSYDLFDKIIKLAIVWESTICCGKNRDIQKTFVTRASKLLGENTKDILEIAYKTRSEIVHNGHYSPKLIIKIKEITKTQSNLGALVNLIKNHLEPLTREILNKFLLELSLEPKKTLKQIAKKYDSLKKKSHYLLKLGSWLLILCHIKK